jgi:DNA-binding XRE family transcriptional regulator
MVKTHRWADVARQKLSPEQIAEADAWVERESLEMNLRELRKALGKTQAELATAAELSQPELSKAERRGDHLLSTLRRYVEALGGQLEVVARFDDKTVKLTGI